jgi:hypothetical protein
MQITIKQDPAITLGRKLATTSVALLLFSGIAKTAHADGVRPDACWTEGDACGNAMGSHPGICTRARCSRSAPNTCEAGSAGEAGQEGGGADTAGFGGLGPSAATSGCSGTHARRGDLSVPSSAEPLDE